MAKVKISDELWARVKEYAAAAGYASPEEFVGHALENALAAAGAQAPEDEEEI